MKKLIPWVLLVAAFIFGEAHPADRVLRVPGAVATLTSAPCEIESILDDVRKEVPDKAGDLRGGHAVVKGEVRKLCWITPDGFLYIIEDEKGEGGSFPVFMFEQAPSVGT